jgi:hypothetical protein
MAIGWQRVASHFGQIMIGRRSVRWRIISNDRLPEPTITAARNSVTRAPPALAVRVAGLLPAREVGRQPALAESAQVDHVRCPTGGGPRRTSCGGDAGRARRKPSLAAARGRWIR